MLDIFNIDTHVLQDPSGWADVKSMFQENTTSSMPESTLTTMNHLIYIRALSRVLVDRMTFLWNRDRTPEERVHLMAAGSVGITSDYDVSMSGPSASLLAKEINTTFEEQTGHQLSEYADTNLYFTPWADLTKERALYIGSENLRGLSVNHGETSMYILMPTFENGGLVSTMNAAIHRLQQARDPGYVDEAFVPCDGDDVYSLGAQFEHLVYECTELDWGVLWGITAKAQVASPDAYFSVATMLVIVVEMQKFAEEPQDFVPEVYLASAIENTAELIENGLFEEHDDQVVLGTIKYVYRVVYSLCRSQAGACTAGKYLELLRKANRDRTGPGYPTSDDFNQYKGVLPRILSDITTSVINKYV